MAGLSKHIDPDQLLNELTHLSVTHPHHAHNPKSVTHFTYGGRYARVDEPRYKMPDKGIPSDTAHQLIKDELDLDGRVNLNLASFVNTYMEPSADQLVMENIAKNLADADEYPSMMSIHTRCISILANMWGIPKGENAIGSATTGSSEAIHLGGLAMKRRWQEKRRAEGKDTLKPNIIMGANAQVALEKFARYFEVEARIIPVSEESRWRLDETKIEENVDENTIGIFVILGSTYTGHYEPVEAISKILDKIQEEKGWDVPIHVDGASGAFVAPFVWPEGKWGFDIPRVKSINTSGHKFGLVYAGLGWILYRSEEYLPKDLIFELHYLGGTELSYTLNFSRPGAQVIAQYFNFLHLGTSGYEAIMSNCLRNARLLSWALEKTGWYVCVSDIHRKRGSVSAVKGLLKMTNMTYEDDPALYEPGLPVVAFRLTDEFKKTYPHVQQASVSTLLRVKGYIIPNYPLPPHCDNVEILRVVVRESFSTRLLDQLISDIITVTEHLTTVDIVDMAAFSSNPSDSSDGTRKTAEKIEGTGQDHGSHNTAERAAGSLGKGKSEFYSSGGLKAMTSGIHKTTC